MPRANPVVENVLGTVGTICWTGQIIPQNWKSWREHSTEGLSGYLMLIWAVSAVFLGVYTTVQKINIPLIIQPQLFGALAALSWTQCLYYSERRSFRFCALMYTLYCTISAGFETGMYFVTKHALENGNPRPVRAFGILSAVIVAIGLLPQYWVIWKRKEVLGISYFFIAVDISGGVFSLLSLGFKSEFDIVAAVTYIVVVIMDSAIIVAAIVLNPRARRRRAREGSRSLSEDVRVQPDSPVMCEHDSSPSTIPPQRNPERDVETNVSPKAPDPVTVAPSER